MDVKELAKMGGIAAAKALGKQGRRDRAKAAGIASQAKITLEQRSARAKKAWETKKKNAKKA